MCRVQGRGVGVEGAIQQQTTIRGSRFRVAGSRSQEPSASAGSPPRFWHSTLDPQSSTKLGPTGVEPARPCGHKALNLARLPIPPRAQVSQFTRPTAVLQARVYSYPVAIWQVPAWSKMNGMYERFTDRARKVMKLANSEAQRFNHEYIGTEHVLLGLIQEGSGVAANVLKNLGVDLQKVRLEVEKLVQSGPDMVTMGKLPQTPRAKKVIEYSMEESLDLGHNYVGTEHLLLGLLREEQGVAAQVLLSLGLQFNQIRQETITLLAAGSHSAGCDQRWSTSKAPQAIIRQSRRSYLRAFATDFKTGKCNGESDCSRHRQQPDEAREVLTRNQK